jgi:hypothetical protein
LNSLCEEHMRFPLPLSSLFCKSTVLGVLGVPGLSGKARIGPHCDLTHYLTCLRVMYCCVMLSLILSKTPCDAMSFAIARPCVACEGLALTRKWKISIRATRICQRRPHLNLSSVRRDYFPVYI